MSKSKTPDDYIWQIITEARELRQAHRRGDASACARIRKYVPRFFNATSASILAASDIDSRLVVAREHGYDDYDTAWEILFGHKFLRGDASLEHLKKQAKKLVRAFGDGDAVVLERIREHWGRETFSLNDAQFVLAREYGFDSWPKLVAKLEVPDDRIEMSRPQLLVLEGIHDRACAGMGRLFSRHLRAEAWCDTIFVDQTTYGDVVGSLSLPCSACSFAVDTMSSRAALDIATPLATALLDRNSDVEQPLTPQERAAMEPIFLGVLGELQQAWALLLPTVLSDMQILNEPSRLQITRPESLVVLIGLEVCTPQIAGLVPAVYPVPDGLFDLRQHFSRS